MLYAIRFTLAAGILACGLDVTAQTIGDYSRSQRAVIEAEIAKNNAKVLAAASPSPSPPPQLAPPLPPPPSGPIPSSAPPFGPIGITSDTPRTPERAPSVRGEPHCVVTGVFLSTAKVVTEVIVEGNPYFLGVGDEVPGTSWRVDSIDANRVVLAGVPGKGNKATPTRRVITLAGGEFR